MAVTPTSCSFLRETGWTCSTAGRFSHRSQNPERNSSDRSYLEEPIQDGNCEVQSLLQQLEPGVNLDQPVDEQSPHALGDFITLHVVCSYSLLHLWKQTAMEHKMHNDAEKRLND